jgi:hypothetical protein
VSQRADQQVPVTEGVSNSSFQLLQVRCGHPLLISQAPGSVQVWEWEWLQEPQALPA